MAAGHGQLELATWLLICRYSYIFARRAGYRELSANLQRYQSAGRLPEHVGRHCEALLRPQRLQDRLLDQVPMGARGSGHRRGGHRLRGLRQGEGVARDLGEGGVGLA